jgi:imidazolonepropionase-like amidohydrolase
MKNHITCCVFTLLFAFSWKGIAQHVPAPATSQSSAIVIRGAMAHLGTGQAIENSIVAFDNGKITFVGDASTGRAFPSHQEINAAGKHLYPGFIAPNSTLGLQEIGAVRATADNAEIGEMNPNIRSIIAYNTDSEVTPTVRSMGVLMAEVVPDGSTISGSSSVVVLDAWNWEDATYAPDMAIHLEWPSVSSFNWREQRVEKNERYDQQLRDLESFFNEAKAYYQKAKPETVNLRFEAMNGLFDGSKRLFVHAGNVQSIQEAVLFAEKFQLTPTIVGGQDAWMITDFLKQHKVAVILESTQRLPSREDEDVDQPFKTPAQLQAAGVQWCFSHGGYWQQRNLAFQAGQAVPFGLAYEDAVKALTSSTATILGIDKTVGTLEAGKDATLFLSDGDALDMRTAKLIRAFIRGREINLDNKQEMLYRRFQKKYQQR